MGKCNGLVGFISGSDSLLSGVWIFFPWLLISHANLNELLTWICLFMSLCAWFFVHMWTISLWEPCMWIFCLKPFLNKYNTEKLNNESCRFPRSPNMDALTCLDIYDPKFLMTPENYSSSWWSGNNLMNHVTNYRSIKWFKSHLVLSLYLLLSALFMSVYVGLDFVKDFLVLVVLQQQGCLRSDYWQFLIGGERVEDPCGIQGIGMFSNNSLWPGGNQTLPLWLCGSITFNHVPLLLLLAPLSPSL